ncbi:MAG: hypothetical protein H8D96_19065 [Desulfobacterales bacterium]|uniref:Uncharacterized protein n=1 Tax=Candidatus Desulfatibia vada TaxID=2841696 RepID=A0A8J6TNZ6_9BACT|nr:hypothetical protein [Candidatus Desulfatibia vada]MBL6971905.1 hypothetical protein [Desulfobacterales bacterium]
MLKEVKNISADSNKNIHQAQKKIARDLKQLAKESFTGQVTIKLVLNQGGIRDSRITLEKKL